MRRSFAVPLLMSVLAGCSARTTTDGTPPPSGPARRDTLPASLARRLAEAADGYRDGENKWIVASRRADKGNHRVVGVFTTFEKADSVAQKEGGDYSAYGPYRTPREEYRIPPGERVDSVTVYADDYVRTYGADSVDAIFWGLPAFDKFIVPYLSSVVSAEYADEQRDLYQQDESKLAGSEQVVHKRGSF